MFVVFFLVNVLQNLEKAIIVYSHSAQKMIKDAIYNRIKNDKNTEYNNTWYNVWYTVWHYVGMDRGMQVKAAIHLGIMISFITRI